MTSNTALRVSILLACASIPVACSQMPSAATSSRITTEPSVGILEIDGQTPDWGWTYSSPLSVAPGHHSLLVRKRLSGSESQARIEIDVRAGATYSIKAAVTGYRTQFTVVEIPETAL